MVKRYEIFRTGVQDKYRVVFPTPQYEEYFDSTYLLKEKYDTFDFYAFYLQNKGGNGDISLLEDRTFGEEEYAIKVDGSGAMITYKTPEGLFRAFNTLRQLIDYGEGKSMPFCAIKDWPHFANRGIMLNISNAYHKKEFVKKFIDILVELRYNQLQLYMETNHCFKYKNFPQFGLGIETLTPDDIMELDEYAKERYIELVPAINSFGHMVTWLETEEYKYLAVDGDAVRKPNTLNINYPEALDLIDKIYGSVFPYFSSKKVNIGMDEAWGLGRNQLEEICKKQGKLNVFSQWLHKVTQLAENKYGKEVMYWADMIREDIAGGVARHPKTAIPIEWGYETIQSQLGSIRCEQYGATGHPFYVAPSTQTWNHNIVGALGIADFNIRTLAEAGHKNGAIGYLLTVWSSNCRTFEVIPMAIAAQYCWNVGVKQEGGWRKAYFKQNAERYADRYIFHGDASKVLSRMASLYRMDPDRRNGSTHLNFAISAPLSETIGKEFCDVTEVYEEYDVDAILFRARQLTEILLEKNFDAFYKKEAVFGFNYTILCAEYLKIKITGKVTTEKAEEIKALTDWCLKEFDEIDRVCNFKNPNALIPITLKARVQELNAFIKD